MGKSKQRASARPKVSATGKPKAAAKPKPAAAKPKPAAATPKPPARKRTPVEPPIRPTKPGIRPDAITASTPAPAAPPPVPAAPALSSAATPRIVPAGPPGELAAVRDVGRLLRHGETFGAHRIEIRHLPTPVVVTSGRIAVADPLSPSGGRVLARQIAPGRFRVMLGVAVIDGEPRIAAAVLHVGRPPIARWVIAHHEGGKPPKSADQLPVFTVDAGTAGFMDALVLESLRATRDAAALVPQLTPVTPSSTAASATWTADETSQRNIVAFTSGWGDGSYAAYWALDGAGQPVCLVVDFDVFTKADWKQPKIARR